MKYRGLQSGNKGRMDGQTNIAGHGNILQYEKAKGNDKLLATLYKKNTFLMVNIKIIFSQNFMSHHCKPPLHWHSSVLTGSFNSNTMASQWYGFMPQLTS